MIGINPATYNYKPKVSRHLRQQQEANVREKIEQIQLKFPTAGYRTVGHYLVRDFNLQVNSKKIRRIMKKYNLQAEIKRAFVATTDSNHKLPIFQNLICGMSVTDVNQVWEADITYIRIQNGFVYLAVILDVYSRKVVGYALSRRIDAELTIAALQAAIESRKPKPGLIHHSDRGSQYASRAYCEVMENHQIRGSMSAKGNPYDNAFAERFMKTLKYEEVYLWNYETILDVQENIPKFIEEIYNEQRIHSKLGYLTPSEFEQKLISDKQSGVRLEPLTL